MDSGKHERIGIAIAGGGTRSIGTSHGILRGLQQQRIQRNGKDVPALDGVDVISGVSAGSWAASMYVFAKVSSDTLLDVERTTDPKEITADDLLMEKPNTMGSAIAEFDRSNWIFGGIYTILSLGKFYRAWTLMVYRSLFKPLGIPRNKFFSSSKEEVTKIITANVGVKETDFIIPREEVKAMLITNFTMLAPSGVFKKFQEAAAKVEEDIVGSGYLFLKPETVLKARNNSGGVNFVPFIATLDAVGSPYGLAGHTMTIDGSPVMNFPVPAEQPWKWGPKGTRFSLELASSMSSSYVQMAIISSLKSKSKDGYFSGLKSSLCLRADQRLTQIYDVPVGDGKRDSLMFVDGGLVDTTGVPTLVHRKVPKILFIQNVGDMDLGGKCCYMELHEDTAQSTDYQLWLKDFSPMFTCLFGYVGNPQKLNGNVDIQCMNHIFDDGEVRLKELMEGMGKLANAGNPLIYTLKGLNVIDNPYFGTVKGHQVDLTFYFANLPKNFAKEISSTTAPPPPGKETLDEYGRFTNNKLKLVPEVGVAGLSGEEVNMMGYLGSWVVKESWDGLYDQDGSIVFEGFKDFFTD